MTKLNVYKARLKMYRLFTNSGLLSKMGECNIYYISINIYILYLGLENTTFNICTFLENKKIYTLIFRRGNQGNQGNRVYKLLKLQQGSVPTFGVFGSPSSPFSFWQQKLDTLFFNDFSEKPKYYHNAYFLCIFTLISVAINKLRQYHHYALSIYIFPVVFKPPDTVMCFKNYLCFLVCRREFLRWI